MALVFSVIAEDLLNQ